MMQNQGLYLSGCGYLHAIELRNHQWYVEICRIGLFGEAPQANEALWMNCDVADTLEGILPEYVKALQKNQVITLQFTAQYQGVVALYSGLTPDDPVQLVTLKAKLVEMARC